MGLFNKVKLNAPQYGEHNLSHDNKLTFEIGKLVPILNSHMFPGDNFRVGAEHLIRFAPLLSPVFQRYDVRLDTVFTPERILDPRVTEDFYRGGKNGNTDIALPTLRLSEIIEAYQDISAGTLPDDQINFLSGTLYDYLNLPTFDDLAALEETRAAFFTTLELDVPQEVRDLEIVLYPFAAYQAVYREYYRAQFVDDAMSVEDEIDNPISYAHYLPDFPLSDIIAVYRANPNTALSRAIHTALFTTRDVNFPQDYFTSALPTPQLGNSVQIPSDISMYIGDYRVHSVASSTVVSNSEFKLKEVSRVQDNTGTTRSGNVSFMNTSTIPDLRKANKLQDYLERSLLGGNRFIDWILNMFGVHSSDSRLDRPEFISRARDIVSISEVTQTSASIIAQGDTDSPLGEMAGHGMSVGAFGLCEYSAEEPGWLQVYVSVVPRSAYFQGIPKEFTKLDRFDYLIPQFSEIGMQDIKDYELFASDAEGEIFGYTERYAEYRFMHNEIHGDFRNSLSYWHSARMFGSGPDLSPEFLKVSARPNDLNRVFAYTGQYGETVNNHLYMVVNFNINARRALPLYPRYSL